jgi:exopolysaccharide biosynthesis protein
VEATYCPDLPGADCTTAYKRDGGGSSTMYFMGEVVNDPLGRGQEREVGDIVYVVE